jgi:hypothetical protein
VGLTLAADASLGRRACLAAAGALAEYGETLEVNLGEGPCVQALERAEPVLVPDLDGRDDVRAWPVYAGQARAKGIRAVFVYPVVDGDRTGSRAGLVLSLYDDRPGPLSAADLRVAGIQAHAAELLLLSVPMPAADTLAETWLLPLDAVIHQAVGVISYRHAVSTDQALALLRAHAHAEGVDLADLAAAVVHGGRRLPAAG